MQVSDIIVTWTPETSGRVASAQIRSRIVGTSNWTEQAASADPAAGSFRFTANAPDTDVEVQLRYRMVSGGFSSWVALTTHTAPAVVRYATVTGSPTSLAGINSAEGSKLGGIATGATKNTTTYSTSAPSSPGDGDIWGDTSASPTVFKMRVSGAWQIAANYVTTLTQVNSTEGAKLSSVASGATKNSTTYSTSAPSSSTDGDFWVDTSSTPYLVKLRVSGAWQVSSNYVTGTGQLTDTANLGGTAIWTGVSGTGKPADNAGTSGLLTPIGSFTRVVGNTVAKFAGTHGAFQGGAVGSPSTGTLFISGSLVQAAVGGSWYTCLALDDDATSFTDTAQKYMAIFVASAAGNGPVYITSNGTTVSGPISASGLTANSHMTFAYDGTKVFAQVDGQDCGSFAAASSQKLWPKVIDYYNTGDAGYQVIDVLYGPWTDNSLAKANDVTGWKTLGTGVTRLGNTVTKTSATAWDQAIVGNKLVNSAYVEADINPSGSGVYTIVALDDDNTSVGAPNQLIAGYYQASSGTWAVVNGGSGLASGTIAANLTGKLRLTYDGTQFGLFVGTAGQVWGVGTTATEGQSFYPKVVCYDTGVTYTGCDYGTYVDNRWSSTSGSRNAPANNAGTNFTWSTNAGTYDLKGNGFVCSGVAASAFTNEGFVGGANVSARLTTTGTYIGLAGSSIDCRWHRSTGGTWYIYEGGFFNLGTSYNGVTFSATTQFQITYDGQWIRWLADGAEMRSSRYLPNIRCRAYVQADATGDRVDSIQFISFTNNSANTGVVLVPGGNSPPVVTANSAKRSDVSTGSWSGWWSSQTAIAGPCRVTSKLRGTNTFIGLGTLAAPLDPSNTYVYVGYAIHCSGGRACSVWTAGTILTNIGTFGEETVFEVINAGNGTWFFLADSALVYTVTGGAVITSTYAQGACANTSASFTDVTFTKYGGQLNPVTGSATSTRLVTPFLSRNLGGVYDSIPLTTSTSSGGVATIYIAAHSIKDDLGTLSYSAGSISGLAASTTYLVYADDNYTGGTVTYVATTNPDVLAGSAFRRYIGKLTTGAAGGSGTVSPGGGGGGTCVTAASIFTDGRTGYDISVANWIDAVDVGTWLPMKAQVRYAQIKRADCVRLTTEHGWLWEGSTTTPFTLECGTELFASEMLNNHVLTMGGDWQQVVRIDEIGEQEIVHIDAGGATFFAGVEQGKMIASHNMAKPIGGIE